MSDKRTETMTHGMVVVSRKHRPADALPAVDSTSREAAPCRGAAKSLLDLCRSLDSLLWQSFAESKQKETRDE
jgi:hypothetical protein